MAEFFVTLVGNESSPFGSMDDPYGNECPEQTTVSVVVEAADEKGAGEVAFAAAVEENPHFSPQGVLEVSQA